MENQYFRLEESIHNFQSGVEKMELFYLIDTFCPIIYNNTEKYEVSDTNIPIDKNLIEKTVEDFFRKLNLLDEYLNNIHLKEKNRFIGTDTLEIEVEQRKKELNELLSANELSKEIYDLAIEMEDENLKEHINVVTDDGKLIVTLTGTIEDIYLIVHESIHKIYHQPSIENDFFKDISTGFNQIFLVEVSSIIAELMLKDYLEREKIGVETSEHIRMRFNNTREELAKFHFEMILTKIYNKYHKITDKLIDEELLKEEEPLQTDLMQKKQFYIKYFSYPVYSLPYIFGTIAACSLKEKVQNQPEILNYIGKSIYDNNIEEVLQYLGINFVESYETIEENQFGGCKKTNYKLNEEKRLEMLENYFGEYNKLFTQKRLK